MGVASRLPEQEDYTKSSLRQSEISLQRSKEASNGAKKPQAKLSRINTK